MLRRKSKKTGFTETDDLMVIATQAIEPHGYKLPKHSMVVLKIAYVSGEDAGVIESKVILPEEVVLVGFQVRCDPEE